ncbi:MAG TPA: LptF/LptG family permease [Chitinophagaceae bacterium]|nr:LptF/LptG family permease [Chitinophagaceae bacterium]
MFKKLDQLVVKAFIGPFIATFFITLLVLVMQFFWLYIDDFVGKGLSIDIVLKFIWYQSAVLVPLALPLAVLLSSLMTFGNLGESFELVAIKSAGISLLRFMRPLFIVSVLISGVAFMFSNYIIPVATLKSRTLLSDIVFAKPAFDLKEGVFYDKIPGYAIKIGQKKADSIIKDIVVYEQNNPLQDNFISAKNGIMRVSEDKRFLEFYLKDGWRYQERGNLYNNQNIEYIRIGFKEYKKQFDLSSFQINWTPDSTNKNSEKMFSIRQLNRAIDSLEKDLALVKKRSDSELIRMVHFATIIDSFEKKYNPVTGKWDKKDIKSFNEILPDSAKGDVSQKVKILASSLRFSAESYINVINEKSRNLRRHKIEWHRKITLSLACIVLFLIGAPLGSIIRKGGLGTPLIFAIGFFMLFYFTSTTGEKFAKEDTLSPFAGMWLATFILVPVGVFLTIKAMRDSQLFNKEYYHRAGRLLRSILGKVQKQ